MRRTLLILALVAAALLITTAAACGGGGSSSSPTPLDTSASHEPVTLTVWHPWTVKSEKEGFSTAVAGFEEKYPWITLDIVTFPNSDEFDQTLIKNINAGTPPDVAITFDASFVAKYAVDDLWQDLRPYMEASNFSMDEFAPAALSYTAYQGEQVALPVLTDAYGLYYNKDMFAKAGLSEPPKTMTELADYGKKLTVTNTDGSIDIAGFMPWPDFNQLGVSDLGGQWGGTYFGADGKAHLATDPAWSSALTWQRDLIDFYGTDNAKKFVATWVDKEWTPDQVFEAGHVAMIFDGEWRTKMIQNDGVKFDWATAPFPAVDDKPDLYGMGRAGGTICGIPTGAKNGDAAWLLVQYMSTDTDFLVSLANMLGNVPTTAAAANSPDFVPPPNFQTFIDVWDNPNSSWQPPIVPTGRGYNDYFATFDVKWINHQTDDLQGGLQEVDTQIDNEISMGQAP